MKDRTMNDFYPLNLAVCLMGEAGAKKVYLPGLAELLSSMGEREALVIERRFRDRETLEAVAKSMEITRERVRQIEQKALRKMRAPINARKYIGISLEEHKAKIDEQNRIMLEREKAVYAFLKAPGEVNAAAKSVGAGIYANPIEDLDLSVRSYNCLTRAGKRTVDDVSKMSYSDLITVRNLGRRSADEIVSKLRDIGIEIKGVENETE